MEVVRQSSKGAILISHCSKDLQKLFKRLETHIMDTVELIDEIRQKAYKEGLDDFGLNLIVREILKPLDLSAKRKQEIIKQFSPIPSQPKNLPSPNTPVLVDEIIDVWFPFTTLNPDIDKAKRFLLQIVEESRDGMWVQMKRSRTEVTGIIGDTTAEATV